MSYEFIRYQTTEDGIGVLTLDRPERMNALNGPLLDELADAVGRVEADEAIHVFLLTGAPRPDGRPCFGAGVDLKSFGEGRGVGLEQGLALTNAIAESLTPSIAVIDGVCTTGAAELAVACDLRMVGEQAQISDWHLKNLGTGLGAWGASTRWSRLVGTARTKELFLTGRVIGAEEALRIGFAQARHPSERLWEEALAQARAIAAMSPRGVALTLSHLNRIDDMTTGESLRFAAEAPAWLGVDISMRGKEGPLLGRASRHED